MIDRGRGRERGLSDVNGMKENYSRWGDLGNIIRDVLCLNERGVELSEVIRRSLTALRLIAATRSSVSIDQFREHIPLPSTSLSALLNVSDLQFMIKRPLHKEQRRLGFTKGSQVTR